jgi:hypothetical protein
MEDDWLDACVSGVVVNDKGDMLAIEEVELLVLSIESE